MTLSLSDIEHIADLAKLALTSDEQERFRAQLSAILDHAAALDQVDTSGIPPTFSVLPLRTVLRADEPTPSLPVDDVLANAPDALDGCFRVQVILP